MSILCTTCGSRLRVRDHKLIGQIVACPKCQAMVMIAADGTNPGVGTQAVVAAPRSGFPAGGFTVGEDEIDSEALTQEKIERPDGLMPPIGVTGSPEGDAATRIGAGSTHVTADWQEDFSDLDSIETKIQPEQAETGPPVTNTAQPPGEYIPLDGAVPPVAWQSESSAKVRQLAAVAAIAVIGLLVAVGAFALVIRSWKNSRVTETPTLVAMDSTATSDGESPENSDDLDEPLVPVPVDIDDPADPNQAPMAPDSETPSSETPDSDSGEVNLDSVAEDISAGSPAADDAKPEIGEQVAGLPLPEPLFPEVSSGGKGLESEADAEGTAVQLPPSLAQYMEVIQLGKPDANVIGNVEPAPPAMEQLKIQFPQMVAPDTEFPPPAPPVDVRARGKMRILGFMAEDQPLDQIIRVVGQASGIPIELDLLSFDVAGMQVNQPVAVKSQETEAALLLAKIVQAAGCVMQLDQDSIVKVSPGGAAIEASISAALRLDDFENRLPLPESEFKRLLSGENDAAVSIEAGMVKLESDIGVKVRAALLLDAIRSARGLPRKLDVAKTNRWIRTLIAEEGGNDGSLADWAPVPDHEVGFREDQEYGTDLVLGDLAADMGAGLVIDWTSCWTHGFTPEAKSLPWFDGKKTHQVIEQVLNPFALQAFAPAEGVIWVGSQEAYEKMPLFAILQTSLSADVAVHRIADAIERPVNETAAWIDDASKRLIVYLPRYVVRELPTTIAVQP